MVDSAKLEALLTLDEGNRLMPYTDTRGKVTIGRGHNLTDCGISLAISDALYREDTAKAQADLTAIFPEWQSLDDVRQAVFLDLAFNLDHKLALFHDLLTAARAGRWNDASAALINSAWYHQVGNRGPRLAQMLQSGNWPTNL